MRNSTTKGFTVLILIFAAFLILAVVLVGYYQFSQSQVKTGGTKLPWGAKSSPATQVAESEKTLEEDFNSINLENPDSDFTDIDSDINSL